MEIGEAWTKAWRQGLRGSQQGLDDRGTRRTVGSPPSGVDAGELRTGEDVVCYLIHSYHALQEQGWKSELQQVRDAGALAGYGSASEEVTGPLFEPGPG